MPVSPDTPANATGGDSTPRAQPRPPLRTYLLLTLAIGLLRFHVAGDSTQQGLDPSFRYAFNRLIADSLPVGEGLLFPLGPWAYLLFPQPTSGRLLLALLAQALIYALYCVSIVHLARLLRPGQLLVPAIALFWLLGGASPVFTLSFLPLILCLIHRESADRRALLLAAAVAGIAFLVRASIGYIALGSLLWYLVLSAARTRRYADLLITPLTAAAAFLAAWATTPSSFGGALAYLRASFEYSRGYGIAMSTGPPNSTIAMVAVVGALIAAGLLSKDRRRTGGLLLLLLPAAWLWWKWSYVRMGHIGMFLSFLLIVLGLGVLYARRLGIAATLAFALAPLAFLFNLDHVGMLDRAELRKLATSVVQVSGPQKLWERLLRFPRYRAGLEQASLRAHASVRWPPGIRERIGDAGVDVYPSLTSLLAAVDVTWRPRPVFQAYTAYTPWLANRNAEAFASTAAPSFLVWHGIKDLTGIDDRYVLNHEPSALRAILRWYDLTVQGPVALLERRATPVDLDQRVGASTACTWNEWVAVPAATGRLITAGVQMPRTLTGRVRLLAAKEAPVLVDYQLADGSTRTHRVVPDLVADGLWASPYIERMTPEWQGEAVERMRFRTGGESSFRDEIHVTWMSTINPFAKPE